MAFPGNLYPYHIDNSHVTNRYGPNYSTISWTKTTPAEKLNLGSFNDTPTAMTTNGGGIFIYFPQPMDLDAVWLTYDDAGGWITDCIVSTSTNSVGPEDNEDTWSGSQSIETECRGKYFADLLGRGGPVPLTIARTGVIAIRFIFTTLNSSLQVDDVRQLLIWGRPSSSHTLAFWDDTNDIEAPDNWCDFGQIAPGNTSTVSVRLKNLSPTKTANNISIDVVDAFRDMDASVSGTGGGVEFSDDGGSTWSESLNITSLGPGAVSGVIQIRRTVESGSNLDADGGELRASVGSWS